MRFPRSRRRSLLARTALWLIVAVAACSRQGPAAPTPPAQPPGTATCTPAVGTTCFGTSQYVEFVVGDFPVVISVPHGGAVAPASIPDRTFGTTVTDTNTIDLGRQLAQAMQNRTGRRPHLIICHLRRTKLDANREIIEGAQGNAEAGRAWTEYHGFIDLAISTAAASAGGRGFYIDLHGHGHPIQRLELGYLLSSATLALPDPELAGYAGLSSLRLAMPAVSVSFPALLRGPTSLGGFLGPAIPSVPSPEIPSPGTDPYFDGGYSTERYSARLPGLQIEAHFTGVRDTSANRIAAADRIAAAVLVFVETHLGLR